jgi:hypothetical protein
VTAPAIDWLPPWRGLDADERAGLQSQLEREIGFRHPLAGQRASIVGRRVDNDDVVAVLGDGSYVNVHLAWARSAFGLSRAYPTWFRYGALEAFADAMSRDAAAYRAHA